MNIREYKVSNVSFIEIKGKEFVVTLSSLGASIYEIKCGEDYLSLTPESYGDFFKPNIYHGKTIGPVANRIKNSETKIGDKLYKFEPNENGNLLHSGLKGLSNQLFDYEISSLNKDLLVKYTYFARDFVDGFPGNRTFNITYKIRENSALEIDLKFDVISDEESLFRLTNHSYFSLGEKSIGNLTLLLRSKKYILPSAKDLTLIREEKMIDSLDYNKAQKLQKSLSDSELINSNTKGIDHFFYFDGAKKLSLSSEKYRLDIKTDFEGVQLYSDGHEDETTYKGTKAKKFRGLAVEPGDSHLYNVPSKEYHRYISYKFTKNLFIK